MNHLKWQNDISYQRSDIRNQELGIKWLPQARRRRVPGSWVFFRFSGGHSPEWRISPPAYLDKLSSRPESQRTLLARIGGIVARS